MTPKVAEAIHKGIAGFSLMIFENSIHLTMWDEEGAYLKAVKNFISN